MGAACGALAELFPVARLGHRPVQDGVIFQAGPGGAAGRQAQAARTWAGIEASCVERKSCRGIEGPKRAMTHEKRAILTGLMAGTRILDILRERGFVQQVDDEAGLRALLAGPVTFYFGFDPTADSLHVGSLSR